MNAGKKISEFSGFKPDLHMTFLSLVVLSFFIGGPLSADEPGYVKPDQILPVWNDTPPGLVASTRSEIWIPDKFNFQNVSIPQLWVYLPKTSSPNRPALIICPGGGFGSLDFGHHLLNVVSLLTGQDMVVIGLKYRTNYGSNDYVKDSLMDCKRALRLVRVHAREWGIDPHRVGLQGYSAGATVCMNVLGNHDEGNPSADEAVERESSRPDFVALMSPWPNKKSSPDYPMGKNPPPVFIASAEDDKTAPQAFALEIADTLEKQRGKVYRFMVPTGGHGAFHYASSHGPGVLWPETLLPLIAHSFSPTPAEGPKLQPPL